MEFAEFFASVVLLWLGVALVVLSLRLTSFTAFALALYVASCAELIVLAEVLSPGRNVTTRGYLVGEAAIAAAAGFLWMIRGKPRPPAFPSQRLRELRSHRLILVFACAILAALAYELFLGLLTPPNNWDALWYHLARAAAWDQHHAVTYIKPVNTQLLNSYPPNAEMQILFGLVTLGRDTFATIPQFLAEIALLTSIYGIARRVGFPVASSLFAALLFSTFSIVALESVTSQNDLCVAACVATAAFFFLGSNRAEFVLGGAAAGIAVGTKFTGVFAIPVLAVIVLAAQRGRSRRLELAGWSIAGIASLGAYGYVMNLLHTGHLSGAEQDTVRAQLSPLSTVSTTARTLYRFIDLSGAQHLLSNRIGTLGIFLAAPALAGLALVLASRRGRSSGWVSPSALGVALVACAPLATLIIAGIGHALILIFHIPLNLRGATQNPFDFFVNRRAHEGLSYFGPLGVLLLWPVSIAACVLYARGRVDRRAAAFAASLPIFLIVLATGVRYSLWLGRFFIVPVALVTPLCAVVYRNRVLASSVAAVGLIVLASTQLFDEGKPTGLGGTQAIWSLSRADAQSLEQPSTRPVLEEIAQRVPARANLGLLLRPKDWSYPFYGQNLGRRVTFLTHPLSQTAASALAISFVVEHAQDGGWSVSSIASGQVLPMHPLAASSH